jgi:adenylyl cyclase-associated protein
MTQQHLQPLHSSRPAVHIQGNLLTTVIRRLEAATSRLEDIASSSVGFDAAGPNGAPAPAPGSAVGPSASSAPTTPKPTESVPPSIQAFDDLLNNELKTWLGLSTKLGSDIDDQVRWIRSRQTMDSISDV